MKNYDFTQDLSPIDFELLSKDLLEKALGVRLEHFREGSDGGIDLRHASNRSGSARIIVQCKRYAPGAFSRLYAHLKDQELPKIQKLGSIRYILCTSVSLSPQNVDALVALLAPHVHSPADIVGRERLNGALADYPDIERRHLKLWIGNAGMLESLIAPRGRFITEEEIRRAACSARMYVQNESLRRAQSVLEKEHVCVISGNPGIGKTTLAHILMLSYAERGFEVVKIESNIDEVRGVAFHEKDRFYLYDDFLGQNSRDQKLGKNEDQKIIDFIHSVRQSKRSVFVMTTRDYLLRQSQVTYEKLDRFNFSPMSCVIELKDYTQGNRAQIIYNHVAFSKIPAEHVETFVTSRVYVDIMKHAHFNPRVIQFITDPHVVASIQPREFPGFCKASLDNPSVIWRHAFQQQLSPAGQDLIIALASFGARIFLDDLRSAFEVYHPSRSRNLNRAVGAHAFANALKELAGNFISITGRAPGTLVEFHNPSIQDYAMQEIREGRLSGGLIESACFFEQVQWLSTIITKNGAKSTETEKQTASCIQRMQDLVESPTSRLYFFRYHDGRYEGHRVKHDGMNRVARVLEAVGHPTPFVRDQVERFAPKIASGEFPVTAYASLVETLSEKTALPEVVVAAVVSHLSVVEDMDIEELEAASCLIKILRTYATKEQAETALAGLEQNAENYAVSIEISDVDNPDTLREDVRCLARIGESLGVDLSRQQSAIEEKVEEMEQRAGDAPDHDDYYGSGRYTALPRDFSDRDADALFRTLTQS